MTAPSPRPDVLAVLIRRLGYRLGLIRYCIHCDGSINEIRARDRLFRPDRWLLHRQHERVLTADRSVQGPARMDLPRQGVASRFTPDTTTEKASKADG